MEAVSIVEWGQPLTFKADTACAAGDLVLLSGMDDDHATGRTADADATIANGLVRGLLWVNVWAVAAGAYGRAVPAKVLTGVDTSGALKQGDAVYLATTAGGWTATKPTRCVIQQVGIVLVVDASAGAVLLAPQAFADPRDLRVSLIAEGGAITDTVSESNLLAAAQMLYLQADSLRAGTVVRVSWQGIVTASNATDTLTVKLKIGSTVIRASAAVDVADNHTFSGEAYILFREVGAAGKLVAHGWTTDPGDGTAVVAFNLAETAIDTTALLSLGLTATWSVADAGNSCRLDHWHAEVLR